MKRILFLFIFCACASLSQAQMEGHNWVFGRGNGLSFTQGTPAPFIVPRANNFEANACISTPDGKLLLYTSYEDSLKIHTYSGDYYILDSAHRHINLTPLGHHIGTVTMGFLILPNDGKFFLLTHLDGAVTANPKRINVLTLLYQNNQFFPDTQFTILIHGNLSEKMAAIRHGNGVDWWILFYEGGSLGKFYSILLSRGEFSSPVSTSFGTTTYLHRPGQLFFSVSGDKVGLISSGEISLFNFDRCLGLPTQLIFSKQILQLGYLVPYGASISPDSRFLFYSSANGQGHPGSTFLNRLHCIGPLDAPNPIDSVIYVDTFQWGQAFLQWGQHKLGPDNKIYITSMSSPQHFPHDSSLSALSATLSVIHNPDGGWVNPVFMPHSLPLPGEGLAGFPNIPDFSLGPLPLLVYQLDTPNPHISIFLGDSVTIGVADTFPQIAYEWRSPDFPGWVSRKMLITVSPPSTTTFYYTRIDTSGANPGCHIRVDTIVVEILSCPPFSACPVPPICEGDTAWLCASGDGSYLWSPPYNLYNAASGGTLAWPETTTVYTVTLTLGNGCTATDSVTVIVHQNSAPTFEDTIIRKGEPFGEFFPTADTTIRYHYLNQYGCDSTVYWEVRIDTLNSVNSEQLIVNSVVVFPNPAQGVLYIKHTNQNAAFRLYNKLGQVVLEQQNLPHGMAAVSLRGLAEGVYFWEYSLVETGERVFWKTVKISD